MAGGARGGEKVAAASLAEMNVKSCHLGIYGKGEETGGQRNGG